MTRSDEGLERFRELLKRRKLKLTHERRHIYERIARLNRHFDADSLYMLLKRDRVRVARGTVYRTIPLLLESGALQKSVGKGKRDYFERKGKRGHHDHMFCIHCHRFIEFYSGAIEALQEKISKKGGFSVLFHDHGLYGYCSKCWRRR